MNSTPAMQEPQIVPLWTKAQVIEWLRERGTRGVNRAAAKLLASDIVYDYEQERRRLTAQVASLQEKVQGLIRLSNENAEIGARYMASGQAVTMVAITIFDTIKAKEQRIAELEAENRELSRMVSLEFEQAMKEGNDA